MPRKNKIPKIRKPVARKPTKIERSKKTYTRKEKYQKEWCNPQGMDCTMCPLLNCPAE